jgi:hypothetical protein
VPNIYDFPVPGLLDPPNGPAAIEALANAVDLALAKSTGALQEGVMDAGSFEVTEDAGGASMTVDVASNTGSGAFVHDDGVTGSLYYVAPTVAKTTVTIGTAHGSNPRVDRVVVSMTGVVSVVAGTATSGATLDNLSGAAAVPSDALLLADVHVPATDTTISNSQIRDRRKWARGGFRSVTGGGSGDHTDTTGTLNHLNPPYGIQLECSGAPVRLTFTAVASNSSNDGGVQLGFSMDGSFQATVTTTYKTGGQFEALCFSRVVTPAAGFHVFTVVFARAGGVGTGRIVNDTAVKAPTFTVEEIVRQNTANNTTTSG